MIGKRHIPKWDDIADGISYHNKYIVVFCSSNLIIYIVAYISVVIVNWFHEREEVFGVVVFGVGPV